MNDEPPSAEPKFSREDYTRLLQSMRIIEDAQALLPKGEACDMDCEYYREKLALLHEELGRYKRRYFDGKPIAEGEVSVPGISQLGPLYTAGHFAELKRAQRAIHDLLPMIDCAESVGNDCSVFRARMQAAAHRLESLEREFMTPPPG